MKKKCKVCLEKSEENCEHNICEDCYCSQCHKEQLPETYEK